MTEMVAYVIVRHSELFNRSKLRLKFTELEYSSIRCFNMQSFAPWSRSLKDRFSSAPNKTVALMVNSQKKRIKIEAAVPTLLSFLFHILFQIWCLHYPQCSQTTAWSGFVILVAANVALSLEQRRGAGYRGLVDSLSFNKLVV